MCKELEEKRLNGVFYTISNPFKTEGFYRWFELIDDKENSVFVEPFAGANNIVSMINEINSNIKWECYDINPSEYNSFDDFVVIKRDTLNNFPKKYRVAITNPPYLAKNSATRRGLSFPETAYDDLYKLSLDVMLQNVDYVAAIIPESFLTQNLFHDRLHTVISLTCKMFEDTECPVCLALFVPEKTTDFRIYRQDKFVGNYLELKNDISLSEYTGVNWKFNDAYGTVGLYAIDNQIQESIRFCIGDDISSDTVKYTSRSVTRISGLPKEIDVKSFIDKCNEILADYRSHTEDVFLTSFKGLRKDNKYRRRLDFKTAKNILNKAMEFYINGGMN